MYCYGSFILVLIQHSPIIYFVTGRMLLLVCFCFQWLMIRWSDHYDHFLGPFKLHPSTIFGNSKPVEQVLLLLALPSSMLCAVLESLMAVLVIIQIYIHNWRRCLAIMAQNFEQWGWRGGYFYCCCSSGREPEAGKSPLVCVMWHPCSKEFWGQPTKPWLVDQFCGWWMGREMASEWPRGPRTIWWGPSHPQMHGNR